MTLTQKLAIVFVAFVAILVIVIYMAFRERKLARTMADTEEARQASDARVLMVIFGAIFGGMFLTLVVAYIVFF